MSSTKTTFLWAIDNGISQVKSSIISSSNIQNLSFEPSHAKYSLVQVLFIVQQVIHFKLNIFLSIKLMSVSSSLGESNTKYLHSGFAYLHP